MDNNFKRAMREVFQGERPEDAGQLPAPPAAEEQRGPVPTTRRESTTITRNTHIRGDIISDSDIILAGELEGTLITAASVQVSGAVTGDIECESCELAGAHINGNIKSGSQIIMMADSVVIGDLTGGLVRVSGDLRGNVTATEELVVHGNAKIVGDIVTRSISVDRGAVIQGNLQSQPQPVAQVVPLEQSNPEKPE